MLQTYIGTVSQNRTDTITGSCLNGELKLKMFRELNKIKIKMIASDLYKIKIMKKALRGAHTARWQ